MDINYRFKKSNRHIGFQFNHDKKMIENKLRHDFVIAFKNFCYPKGYIIYLQSDSNIWWKPRFIRKEIGWIAGWFFTSIGYVKFDENNLGKKNL